MMLAAVNLCSSLQYLVLAISFKAGNWAFSARIRVGLCRMLHLDFGEFPFYEVG
jgi:hypothetical protein